MEAVAEEPQPVYNKVYLINNESQPLLIYKNENWQEAVKTFCQYNDLDQQRQ